MKKKCIADGKMERMYPPAESVKKVFKIFPMFMNKTERSRR